MRPLKQKAGLHTKKTAGIQPQAGPHYQVLGDRVIFHKSGRKQIERPILSSRGKKVVRAPGGRVLAIEGNQIPKYSEIHGKASKIGAQRTARFSGAVRSPDAIMEEIRGVQMEYLKAMNREDDKTREEIRAKWNALNKELANPQKRN